MKKGMKRVIPAALAMSLAVTPVISQAAEYKPGPGRPYEPDVMAKLEDNTMEYGEIEMLIDTYNTTLKNLWTNYRSSKDSMADLDDVKDQIYSGSEQLLDASDQLSETADSMRQMVGFELNMASLTEIVNSIKENNNISINSKEDLVNLKDQIVGGFNDLKNSDNMLGTMGDMFGEMTGGDVQFTTISIAPSAYAELVYNSVLLENQSEQLLLSVNQLTEITPEMMKVQMIENPRAMLISGAQSLLIAYENIRVQKETLLDAIALAEAGVQTTERLAAVGMGTASDINSVKQGLSSAKAGLITLEANEVNIRQQLCNMLGWEYDANPEIPAIPAVDISRVDAINLDIDTQIATNNNFTLKYNRLSEETLEKGSVQMENLQRTIEAEKAEIATSMVKLYNAVLQARNEFYNAQMTEAAELANLAAADRQWSLGMISKMEHLQAQNAYNSAKTNIRIAELNLLQALETYDWAVKGNLTLSQ